MSDQSLTVPIQVCDSGLQSDLPSVITYKQMRRDHYDSLKTKRSKRKFLRGLLAASREPKWQSFMVCDHRNDHIVFEFNDERTEILRIYDPDFPDVDIPFEKIEEYLERYPSDKYLKQIS